MSQTSRRQLSKLQKLLTLNEQQFAVVSKQIDANWSIHQTQVRQNKKTSMHIPNLETIYQTLSKQREILNKQKQRIHLIKSKLGVRDFPKTTAHKKEVYVNDVGCRLPFGC